MPSPARSQSISTAAGAAGDAVAAALNALGGGIDVAIIAHGNPPRRSAGERARSGGGEPDRRRRTSCRWWRCSCRSPTSSRPTALGHIAVLSSVAGERGRPRNYTYGASKAALNVYLQGLPHAALAARRRRPHAEARSRRHADDRRHEKRACSPAPIRSPPTSSPQSTRAGRRPTSPGSGARSWRSSAACQSACFSACRRVGPLVAPRRRRGVRLLFVQVAAYPRFAWERLELVPREDGGR